MGCNCGKAGDTRTPDKARLALFPTSGPDQAAAFERELVGTAHIAGDPPPQSRTVPLNPLAVELAKQYRSRRDALLEERRKEEADVQASEETERQGKRARALGDRAAASDAQELGVAPLQTAFTVLVTKDLAEAQAIGFDARKVAETVKLFPSWLADDVERTKQRLAADNPRSTSHDAAESRRKEKSKDAAGREHEGAWDCEVTLELRGADPASETLLQHARTALDARINREAAPHVRASTTEKGKEPGKRARERTEEPAAAAETDGIEKTGGSGVLFLNAAFVFKVPGSYDRKQPWQMELCFFFTE